MNGMEMGTMIRIRTVSSFAPSSFAASRRLLGREAK